MKVLNKHTTCFLIFDLIDWSPCFLFFIRKQYVYISLIKKFNIISLYLLEINAIIYKLWVYKTLCNVIWLVFTESSKFFIYYIGSLKFKHGSYTKTKVILNLLNVKMSSNITNKLNKCKVKFKLNIIESKKI